MGLKYNIGIDLTNLEALRNLEPNFDYNPTKIEAELLFGSTALDSLLVTRLSRGKYIATVDIVPLTEGRKYTVKWTYELYSQDPKCIQTLTQNFIYRELDTVIEGLNNIYGNVSNFGMPIYQAVVEARIIKTGYTEEFGVGEICVTTDEFGNWNMYLNPGETVSIKIPETGEDFVFIVPDRDSEDIDDIAEIDPPGTDPDIDDPTDVC